MKEVLVAEIQHRMRPALLRRVSQYAPVRI